MSVGQRIYKLRKDRGLTQQELAHPRYTSAHVSTIESGRRNPSPSALAFFAERLGVSIDELKTGRPATLVPELELALLEARNKISEGRQEEARGDLAKVERRARRHGLEALEGRAKVLLGLCAERRGDLEAASELFEQAEEELKEHSITARAEATAGRARCLHLMGDLRYGIYVLESAIDQLRREELEDPVALVTLYSPLIFLMFEAGMERRAGAIAEQALKLGELVEDPITVATMHMNVARVLLAKGQVTEAERSLSRAENLYRQRELATEVCRAHLAHGFMLSRSGDVDRARKELERALEIAQQTGSKVDQARSLNELARLERSQGRKEEAESLAHRSIDLLKDGSYTHELALAHREVGLARVSSDATVAEKMFKGAIELYERGESAAEVAVTYRLLGDLYDSAGDQGAAIDAYRAGLVALNPEEP